MIYKKKEENVLKFVTVDFIDNLTVWLFPVQSPVKKKVNKNSSQKNNICEMLSDSFACIIIIFFFL